MTPQTAAPPYSWGTTLLFAFLLGWAGGHRFYVGKYGTGWLMLVTLGGFGFWWVLDLFAVALGLFQDKQGRFVKWSK
jgi:TM2 domain-containing membrane protein YozV